MRYVVQANRFPQMILNVSHGTSKMPIVLKRIHVNSSLSPSQYGSTGQRALFLTFERELSCACIDSEANRERVALTGVLEPVPANYQALCAGTAPRCAATGIAAARLLERRPILCYVHSSNHRVFAESAMGKKRNRSLTSSMRRARASRISALFA